MRTASFLLWGIAFAVILPPGCSRVLRRTRAAPPDEAAVAPGAPKSLLPLGHDDGVPAAATIRGKVLAADKMLGVVVINVGELHGVRPRYAFVVYRGERFIGKIVVDETYSDMSACRYGQTMQAHIEVGDDVTTKLLGEP